MNLNIKKELIILIEIMIFMLVFYEDNYTLERWRLLHIFLLNQLKKNKRLKSNQIFIGKKDKTDEQW
jgi:hypothetical protein